MQLVIEKQNYSEQSHAAMMNDLVMAMMGVNRLAYIKPADGDQYRVYAADGTILADFDSEDEAFEAIYEHQLTPVQIH